MLRIGFCLHAMQVAGAEVLVSQIIYRLKDHIDPTIFCLDSIGQLGEELQSQGIPVVVLNRKPGLDIAMARRYATELNQRQIQLVHAHQYTPFFYTALARFRGANRTKILMTEHGRHYPDVVSSKRRFVNRWFLTRYADHSTACCRFSAQALEQNDGFRNVEVLYNGIDLANHPARKSDSERADLRARLGMRPDQKYIVCIARFHPVKDHPTLLRGFAELAKTEPNVRLLLVGKGPDEDSLRALASDLGIADRVEFWGVRRDISNILQASDVFSLTSVSEAASITLLEAMANGSPVAITDVGGNGEHVRHGEHGLLSPRGDASALANNLHQLVNLPDFASDLAIAARERIDREFRLEKAISRYMSLYKNLVA
jgi:glycosyltransferase involved in cell wall biosynthesis